MYAFKVSYLSIQITVYKLPIDLWKFSTSIYLKDLDFLNSFKRSGNLIQTYAVLCCQFHSKLSLSQKTTVTEKNTVTKRNMSWFCLQIYPKEINEFSAVQSEKP